MPTEPRPTPDQNAPFVVIPPLTHSQFWGVLGGMAVAYIGLLYVLISIVYGGLNERLKSLEEATRSAIPVLINAPKLEQTLNKAHDDVIILQESIKPLAPLPQQFQAMQIQLNNMQTQIHKIPGVPK